MTTRCCLLVVFLFGALWLAGCGPPEEPTSSLSPAAPSVTPAPPTPTPEPLAALVNGEPIRLTDFQDELYRFEAAQVTSGTDLATLGDYQSQVLQALIDRRLLAQGALAAGAEIDELSIEETLEQLAADIGSIEAMGTWLAENGYTLVNFKTALAEEMLAAQMVELIVAGVAESVEQVYARHILVATRDKAEELQELITKGADFAELARLHSLDPSTRLAGGDLGWFPPGYLLIPEVEVAAFALQPGEVSEVVESVLGFHIVQTIDRAQQPLAPDAMRQLRERTVNDWLVTQRETAEIQVLIAP